MFPLIDIFQRLSINIALGGLLSGSICLVLYKRSTPSVMFLVGTIFWLMGRLSQTLWASVSVPGGSGFDKGLPLSSLLLFLTQSLAVSFGFAFIGAAVFVLGVRAYRKKSKPGTQ